MLLSRVLNFSPEDVLRISRDHLSQLAMRAVRRLEKGGPTVDEDDLLLKKQNFLYRVAELIETDPILCERVFNKALSRRLSNSCYIDY